MYPRIEIWLSGRRCWRVVSGCLLILGSCLVTVALVCWLLPSATVAANMPPPDSRDLKARLRRLPPRQTLASVLVQISDELPLLSFSALVFCQRNAAKFISWRPDAQGGVLILESAWQQIPTLFSQLSRYGLVVRGFTVESVADCLRLTLHLEHINAA